MRSSVTGVNSNTAASADKMIEKQAEMIGKLELVNNKLLKRVEFYENFLQNITHFEKSQRIMDLNSFISTVMTKTGDVCSLVYVIGNLIEYQNF